ncbi:hypothetical protein D9756_001295 [Leucocoprinus leucothites]|uniref:Uncharacterized protein n=1 Tax=Leucocoprinus leucothites TaxID=201217 RepID=A0A8H5G4Y2_9AGAR|nr:hypothetical protein D9756_001295 [Leucoagaricus leucothites]
MLLKFTTTDMFNTLLIDVASGERTYEINTVSVSGPLEKSRPLLEPLSSSKTAAPSEEFFPAKEYYATPEPHDPSVSYRQTEIRDASGTVVAEVQWEGRHPHITIDGQKVGGLNDLFGASTVRFMPKILAIPTKYDPDYVWTATADSLTLVDYATDEIKGTFHQNALRFPAALKSSKPRLSIQTQLPAPPQPSLSPLSPKTLLKSSSRIFSSSPSSPPPSPTFETTFKGAAVKSTFVPTHVPGFGSNYLEFDPHPETTEVEIILSFLIMEILRRGRFNLTPYTFDNPTIWQLKEARDIFLRRMRRNTA